MVVEKFFVKESIKKGQLEEFLREKFDKAGYSHIKIQRTPLGTRIIVYAYRPGLVIGKSGKRIKELTEEIKEKFDIENPMLDVREVENPFLDAQIVANRIVKALERGVNYKKVGNYYLDKVTEAGAVGVEIRIAGKLGGERARFQKFKKGYIKHSGYYTETLVSKGFATALLKPGIVGVQVKILREMPTDLLIEEVEKGGDTESKEDKGNE
ncbi:MAG TPA: 30S ribosomal protein S3 [Candidatus Aenigmarchaeota archaeon]|nr:30S ribosomal protein S3 [Candidatus Aenigmarchaeota archaeon]